MAITSLFYAGDTDTVEWAIGSSRIGIRYVAHGPNDCKVSVVSNATRTVAIAPGRISGGGVSDYNDAEVTIALPNVTSGTTYFLIGARRTWQVANETTFDYIEGTSEPIIPPRPTDAGDEDFQPLALVPVTAGNTVPGTPIDLRCVGINGGFLVAQHDLVRSYMDEVGTSLRIGGSEWHRVANANGMPAWIDVSAPTAIAEMTGPSATASQGSGWTRRSECRLVRDGKRRWLHYVVQRSGSAFRSSESGDLTDMALGQLHNEDRPASGVIVTAGGRVRSFSNSGGTLLAGGHLTDQGHIVLNSLMPGVYVNGGGANDGGIAIFDF